MMVGPLVIVLALFFGGSEATSVHIRNEGAEPVHQVEIVADGAVIKSAPLKPAERLDVMIPGPAKSGRIIRLRRTEGDTPQVVAIEVPEGGIVPRIRVFEANIGPNGCRTATHHYPALFGEE
jgi:hypothetical protein